MLSLFMTYVRLKINIPAKVRKSKEMRSSTGDALFCIDKKTIGTAPRRMRNGNGNKLKDECWNGERSPDGISLVRGKRCNGVGIAEMIGRGSSTVVSVYRSPGCRG